MRYTRNVRPPFDANGEFIHLRPTRVNGRAKNVNDPVDKSAVDARRLRQMYDARLIGNAPEPPPARKAVVRRLVRA